MQHVRTTCIDGALLSHTSSLYMAHEGGGLRPLLQHWALAGQVAGAACLADWLAALTGFLDSPGQLGLRTHSLSSGYGCFCVSSESSVCPKLLF